MCLSTSVCSIEKALWELVSVFKKQCCKKCDLSYGEGYE